MPLNWIANPGVKFMAISGNVTYSISYPDREGRDKWTAQCTKKHKMEGFPGLAEHSYEVDGSPFDRDSAAEAGCQKDFDTYGETVPPHKIPPQVEMPPPPNP